jgi:hypothetical protein
MRRHSEADRSGASGSRRAPQGALRDVRMRTFSAVARVRWAQSETGVSLHERRRYEPAVKKFKRLSFHARRVRDGTERALVARREVSVMYAFAAFEAVQSAAIPAAHLAFDATALGYLGLLAVAALVGTGLGIAMRSQRTKLHPVPTLRAVPRPA